MIKKSVHLQNFPDVSLFSEEEELIKEMDMVRDICSAALFIRDKQNLRVRLPLNKLTIIGKKANKMLNYKEIIADEVNVKNIETKEEIGDLAEFNLQINFKKVGAKLGSKMKEINILAKQGKWEKISGNQIKLGDIILSDDEFTIKLNTKNNENSCSLPSNDCLIELDINVNWELEKEGIARDIIRIIQQNRKDANLDISDHIRIYLQSLDDKILQAADSYQKYIQEQTLADEIIISKKYNTQKYNHNFSDKIEDIILNISFEKINI